MRLQVVVVILFLVQVASKQVCVSVNTWEMLYSTDFVKYCKANVMNQAPQFSRPHGMQWFY